MNRLNQSTVILWLGVLLWPASAFAHGSMSVFYLLWWHVVLILVMIGFLVFSSIGKRRKLSSLAGFVVVPAVVWPILGNISTELTRWQDILFYVCVGAAPVLGFVGGLYLTKAKGDAP